MQRFAGEVVDFRDAADEDDDATRTLSWASIIDPAYDLAMRMDHDVRTGLAALVCRHGGPEPTQDALRGALQALTSLELEHALNELLTEPKEAQALRATRAPSRAPRWPSSARRT